MRRKRLPPWIRDPFGFVPFFRLAAPAKKRKRKGNAPPMTTLAVGEESSEGGPPVRTLAIGEEGATSVPTSTIARGEESTR